MKKSFLKYGIALLVCFVLFFAVLLIEGAFSSSSATAWYRHLSDAFGVPGFIMLDVAGLVWASNQGAFDMTAFSFIKFSDLFKRDRNEIRYHSFQDYTESKSKKRKPCLHMVIVSIPFFLLSLLFAFLYRKSLGI